MVKLWEPLQWRKEAKTFDKDCHATAPGAIATEVAPTLCLRGLYQTTPCRQGVFKNTR